MAAEHYPIGQPAARTGCPLSKLQRINEPITALNDYRLNPGVFFFKLCPAETLDPTSIDMISGMYIPLDYWNVLMASPSVAGPKGGKILTFENVERHFSNSQFIDLVRYGWIGSRVAEKDMITRIVQDALQGKRSVLLGARYPYVDDRRPTTRMHPTRAARGQFRRSGIAK